MFSYFKMSERQARLQQRPPFHHYVLYTRVRKTSPLHQERLVLMNLSRYSNYGSPIYTNKMLCN